MPFAVAAGVGAVAGLAGSALQANATSSAADKATAAQQQAQAQERADLAPWTGTGGSANTATTNLLDGNGPDAANAAMANFQSSPGYQFQLQQGLRATDAGAAASGMLRSGATLKAEQTFGEGLADQDFTNYYNRLFDMSKLGESAAAGTGAADISTGTGIAQTDLSAGSAQANIAGTAKTVGNSGNTLANYSIYQNALGPNANQNFVDSGTFG